MDVKAKGSKSRKIVIKTTLFFLLGSVANLILF